MEVRRRMIGTIAAVLLSFPPHAVWARAARPVPVDVELAFVVDASFSIDAKETRLQRQGYAAAVADERVLRSISAGFLRSVALAYIEFAAPGCARIGVPWTRVSDRASAETFGAAILALPRMECPGGNAIAEAIAVATLSLRNNRFAGTRRIIDVSGDGPDTTFEPVELARDAAVARGITINGLVIPRPAMPNLPEYYRAAIIGGPRAFVVEAESRETFAEAILGKLILEIARADDGGYRPLKTGLRFSAKALMPSR